MNLIIIDRHTGRTRTIPVRSALLLALVVSLLGLGGGLGWLAGSLSRPPSDTAFAQSVVADVRRDLHNDLGKVNALKNQTDEHLTSLTLSLAEMQAKLVRLDALGARLLEKANLQDGEFDFSGAPPVGGPSLSLSGAEQRVDVFAELDQLVADLQYREEQLDVLESLLDTLKFKSEGYLSGRPIRSGWMSSRYGKRTDPFTGKSAWHNGVDFAGKDGSDIVAIGSGVVTWAAKRYGYGLMVEINHGQGYATRYAHARELLVKVGDVIAKGQTIARMGSSGRSTGPHVHFEVIKNGKSVDPARYVNRRAL